MERVTDGRAGRLQCNRASLVPSIVLITKLELRSLETKTPERSRAFICSPALAAELLNHHC
jgi:hypothetical protein